MGYYTIECLPKICDLTTIATEFGKFRYNRVLVEICASGDIFQDKLDDLLGDIKESRVILTIYRYLAKGFPPRKNTRYQLSLIGCALQY